jgi:flavin-dependent dehydrogenase
MTRQATPPEARHPIGHFDAVVVGARAAGAATAMLLARRGLRVLAIDKAAYGSDRALVGDAGYFKDPFAAHGISDAFRDAELLIEAIMDGDFRRYERLRDELSMPLFDVLEGIASYGWDLESLPGLHIQLSQAMRDEEAASKALAHTGVVAA